MKFGFLLRGLVLIALFVGLSYLFSDLINEDWVDRYIRYHGLSGELLFFIVGAVLTGLGVSRQLITFLGGYAFGLTLGTGLALLATVAGCLLSYLVARFLVRAHLQQHFSERMRRIDRFIHHHPFSMTLLLRLLPVGNNLLVNLVAGAAQVRLLPFLLGSALGYLPQTIIFALIGSGIDVDPIARIGTGVALFVISGLLGLYLYRRFRAQGRLHVVTLDS